MTLAVHNWKKWDRAGQWPRLFLPLCPFKLLQYHHIFFLNLTTFPPALYDFFKSLNFDNDKDKVSKSCYLLGVHLICLILYDIFVWFYMTFLSGCCLNSLKVCESDIFKVPFYNKANWNGNCHLTFFLLKTQIIFKISSNNTIWVKLIFCRVETGYCQREFVFHRSLGGTTK